MSHQRDTILHNSTSNFAGALGCSNEQEIRELMQDLVPHQDDSSSVFTTTSLEEANLLDQSSKMIKPSFLNIPEQEKKVARTECVSGFEKDDVID